MNITRMIMPKMVVNYENDGNNTLFNKIYDFSKFYK